jgi:hypothetical protein
MKVATHNLGDTAERPWAPDMSTTQRLIKVATFTPFPARMTDPHVLRCAVQKPGSSEPLASGFAIGD